MESPPFPFFSPPLHPFLPSPPFPLPFLLPPLAFPSHSFPFSSLGLRKIQLGGLGSYNLPQRGTGRSPGRQRIFTHFSSETAPSENDLPSL